MRERREARWSFMRRRRLRSTAMWVIRWHSASSGFLRFSGGGVARGRALGRFLRLSAPTFTVDAGASTIGGGAAACVTQLSSRSTSDAADRHMKDAAPP